MVFLVSIALSGNIGNAEMHKHRVMAEHFAECLCLFDTGHHPQRMAEHITVGIGREGIDAVLVLFCHQIQERTDIHLVYEIALNGTLWDLTPAMRSTRPYTEEFAEVECFGIVFVRDIFFQFFAEIVGINMHLR